MRPALRRVLRFLAFVALVALAYFIQDRFGQTEGVRFWGIGLLVTSLVFTFLPRIPVFMGNRELAPLEGWRKAYVLAPAYAIAILVTAFPHQVACAVHLKGYVCY